MRALGLGHGQVPDRPAPLAQLAQQAPGVHVASRRRPAPRRIACPGQFHGLEPRLGLVGLGQPGQRQARPQVEALVAVGADDQRLLLRHAESGLGRAAGPRPHPGRTAVQRLDHVGQRMPAGRPPDEAGGWRPTTEAQVAVQRRLRLTRAPPSSGRPAGPPGRLGRLRRPQLVHGDGTARSRNTVLSVWRSSSEKPNLM
jgi:hypothetical protein